MRTLTLDEAADLLKTTPETVSAKIRDEGLPAAKVGRAWVLIDVDVAEWVRRLALVQRSNAIPPTGSTKALLAAFKPEALIVSHPRLRSSAPRAEGVYFLIRDGRVTYVGSSQNVRERIRGHATNGRPFDRCAWTLTSPFLRSALETVHIAMWSPPGNKACGKMPPWVMAAVMRLSGVVQCS